MVRQRWFGHSERVSRPAHLDVFTFVDHRAYLRALYERGKQRGLGYRAFSKRAGLGSPNYLKLVIDGERNLTPEMARRFARAAALDDDAALYFEDLVAFCQAKSSKERSERYGRLLRFRQFRRAHRLERSQDAYHSKWYLPAIRELVGCRAFREDVAWIAAQLVPAISASEAAQALKVLCELGLLRRTAQGVLERTDQLVVAPPETRSTHLASFHRTMMQHAAESIDRVPREQRDLTALTLRIPSSATGELKERLLRFRRELLAWSEEQESANLIMQLNFQLFPLSGLLRTEED
jgi:uncharacterized protein (TIGR02147 family)